MLAPLAWLKEYVDITLPLNELSERITLAGLAVDAIRQVGDWWDPEFIRVGRVLAVAPRCVSSTRFTRSGGRRRMGAWKRPARCREPSIKGS